jgi:hypothetical protein
MQIVVHPRMSCKQTTARHTSQATHSVLIYAPRELSDSDDERSSPLTVDVTDGFTFPLRSSPSGLGCGTPTFLLTAPENQG